MGLKSGHWRYLANKISFFPHTLQPHWLLFANFGNLCPIFEVWPS